MAIQGYYREVEMTGYMVKRLKPSIMSCPEDQLPNLIGHGEYVKSLELFRNSTNTFNVGQLNSLFTQIPYLKRINLTYSRSVIHYLDLLYKILKTIHKKKNVVADQKPLSSIEEIDISYQTRTTSNPLYFSVCYAARASLTHLRLVHPEVDLTTEGLTRNYTFFLPYFTNLTHLRLHEICDRYLSVNLYWMLVPN